MTGDEVLLGEDDIEFTGISGPELGIEEGYVDGKKKTPVILDDFRLIGRRDELFDGEGMNGKVFLKIRDVFVMRTFEVDPCALSPTSTTLPSLAHSPSLTHSPARTTIYTPTLYPLVLSSFIIQSHE